MDDCPCKWCEDKALTDKEHERKVLDAWLVEQDKEVSDGLQGLGERSGDDPADRKIEWRKIHKVLFRPEVKCLDIPGQDWQPMHYGISPFPGDDPYPLEYESEFAAQKVVNSYVREWEAKLDRVYDKDDPGRTKYAVRVGRASGINWDILEGG